MADNKKETKQDYIKLSDMQAKSLDLTNGELPKFFGWLLLHKKVDFSSFSMNKLWDVIDDFLGQYCEKCRRGLIDEIRANKMEYYFVCNVCANDNLGKLIFQVQIEHHSAYWVFLS